MSCIRPVNALAAVAFIALTGACRPKNTDEPSGPLVLPASGGETTVSNRSSGAFTLPAANLNDEELALHAKGDSVFESEFVFPPATVHGGLGPVFSNTSCRGCHVSNGRGMPIVGESGTLRSHMLLRLSVDPEALGRFPEAGTEPPAGGPIGVPGMGIQLQDHAAYGLQPEAKLKVAWLESTGRFDDGSSFQLRRPLISFEGEAKNLALLADPGILRSLRQTPPVAGLGLLEAVSESTLLALEDPDDRDNDGVSGRLNRVWDPIGLRVAIGRFGWKASAPSLLVQAAGAFAEDMGVTNPVFPGDSGLPEIDQETLEAAVYYAQTLGMPARDSQGGRVILKGEAIFRQLGCASCHVPELKTGSEHPIAALQEQTFHPYTDLLLHDMGEGLSDGRADYAAGPREWRTAPLWGLGVTQTVLPYSAFLHDGRARTIEEAILWHGGEALESQKSYKALSLGERQALGAFLRSL